MPPETAQDKQASFQRAREVLSGRRIELEAGVSKVLRFMLGNAGGCDVDITADEFIIRYTWHPSNHSYFMSVAPGTVSQILEWAGITNVQSPEQYFTLSPTRVPWALNSKVVLRPGQSPDLDTDGFSAWEFNHRHVWLRVTDDSIHLSIRDQVTEDGDAPPLLPEPIGYPLIYVNSDGQPCPHCGATSESWRKLFSGYLVCSTCGRSFQAEDSASDESDSGES